MKASYMNLFVHLLAAPSIGIRLPASENSFWSSAQSSFKHRFHTHMVTESVESQVSAMNLTGCRKVFLDVGANLGTHVRMVFEGAKYPKSDLRDTLKKYFGDDKWRNQPSEQSGICAIGFEANPNLAYRLKEIQSSYKKMGWKAYYLTPAAVSDIDGTIELSVDKSGSRGKKSKLGVSVGSSIVDRTDEKHTTWDTKTIPSFDFSKFIQKHITDKRGAGGIEHVFAKIDIEGAEFLVLPKLLETGGLCQNKGIDVMTVEWHDAKHRWNHKALAPKGCRLCDKEAVDEAMKKHTQCELPLVVDVDDETYSSGDPAELPTPN